MTTSAAFLSKQPLGIYVATICEWVIVV
jgi:hypothetical protein